MSTARERRFRPYYLAGGKVVPPGRLVGNVEPAPARCVNGHHLIGKGRVIVGWVPCLGPDRTGHRTHECRQCGAVVYTPPLDEPECACELRKRLPPYPGRV